MVSGCGSVKIKAKCGSRRGGDGCHVRQAGDWRTTRGTGTVDPRPDAEGVPRIELSEESLCAAVRAGAGWAAHGPRRLLGLDEPMRVGFRLGLIGVSGPMLEVFASSWPCW